MANQHTKAAAATQPAPAPTNDDGPNLDPTPQDDGANAALLERLAELEAQLEAADAALAARPRVAAPTTVVVNNPVVTTVAPPTEATYEPAEVDDDGVAYAATIVVKGPDGSEVECTPKVFRTILASKGFVAHPTDANMHLGNEPRRTRRNQRGANTEGTPELATAARRRRRAPAAE